jgi:hypothetical protein
MKEASVPYRKDLDVLTARETELARALAALDTKEEELRALRANEGELRGELAAVRARLAAWRREEDAPGRGNPGDLRVEDLRIASPCSASWDDMVGDDKQRFCEECGQSVYNASALTRGELEALLGEHAYQLCLRMYRREDGTVMSADCPVGKRRVRLKQVAAVACGSVLAGVAVAVGAHELRKPKLQDLYSVEGETPGHHHRLVEHAESMLQLDPPHVAQELPRPVIKPPPVTPTHGPRHTMGMLVGPRSRGGAASCDTPTSKKVSL